MVTRIPDPTAFGQAMREARLAAGISLSRLAATVHFSKSHISKVETGRVTPSVELARRVDAALQADGRLATLVATPKDTPPLRLADHPHTLVSDEPVTGTRPTRIDDARLDQAVQVFRVLLKNIRVLGQSLGPPVIMPMVEPQTIALTQLATQPPGHREGLRLASQFATFTGWMAQEMGTEDVALRWTERAAQLAEAAADDDLAAYAYVRRANLALYRGDPHATIALAKQARSMRCTPKVRRQALQREAQGHALAGDYPAFRACIEDARQMSFPEPAPTHPDEPTLGTMNVPDPVALAEGWSLHDLGRSSEAVVILVPLFEATPEASARAWARIGARLALAHAGAGDIDAACDIAERLMPLFPALESATIRSDLRLLARELNRWNTHPRVQLMMPKLSVALMPAQTPVVAG
jgi:transcriptional regulator with XRE-family HTH domain